MPASSSRSPAAKLGLVAGPLLAVLAFWLLPETYVDVEGDVVPLGEAGRATVAVLLFMATWWLTEAIEIFATALLPIAIFPLLGIADVKSAAAPYASELIYLFLGGFLLALAIQRWRLDRRFALLTLRLAGTRPASMVAAFMAVTAVLSAFVSNTATAAVMLPIALSVIALVGDDGNADGKNSGKNGSGEKERFALCVLLGIAYAASIGGVATIVGTPPNGILVQFVKDQIAEPYRQEISFVGWMAIGVPLAAVFLPIVWWLLVKVLYPVGTRQLAGGRELIDGELRRLGRPNRAEWTVFIVFIATALAWLTRPLLNRLEPLEGLTDPGIAMLAGLLLFLLPAGGDRGPLLDWETVKKLPWGVLILFGGGLSLAAAVRANGVAEFLGAQVTALSGAPPLVLVVAVATGVIFLTEMTSNTATTATLVPVLAGIAGGLGHHPLYLIIPAALAASCAFMMPVATPPNAIIFASGQVTIPQMCRAGIWLNLVGIVLITVLMVAVVVPVLGI